MNLRVIGAVFARGGSKRVPRKNLRLLAGKPLIAHAIETGLASRYISRVIVSTDDAEIAEIARNHGAETPFMRPPELASDDASEWLSWQHAIRFVQEESRDCHLDVFVCIPTTSPLRWVEDVDLCIETLIGSDADVVITVKNAEHNPYYNMIQLDTDGFARQVIQSSQTLYRRSAYPTVYDMTTVAYAARPDFVLNSVNPFSGKVKAVKVPAERALDIDTELDMKFAEFLVAQQATFGGASAVIL